MENKDIIEQKISTILDRINKLKRFETISFKEFSESSDTKDIVERNLQVAIEACIDIGKIIISEKALREPSDNKDVFKVLAENAIISSQSLEFLLPMAGMRNLLVHGYDKIDATIIFGVLKRHLEDLFRYLDEIKRIL